MARIDDGHKTLISFDAAPSVKFYEKTVTPPGVDGGGEVDTTTMLNDTYRTRNPKALITLASTTCEVAYDPAVYDDVIALVNVNTEITITFPDESTLVFWGWLNKFTPSPLREGEQPMAEIEIIPSNQNDSGVKTAPDYTAPA